MIKKKFYVKLNIPMVLIGLSLVVLSIHYLSALKCSASSSTRGRVPGTRFKLMVLVLTAPENLEQRDTIRKTWLSQRNLKVKHLFAIGTLDVHREQKETLESENSKYGDLLFLPRLQDAYSTLTKKILHSFKSVYEEYEFDFLLKCDDDSFVLVGKILAELEKWQSKGTRRELYWGFFNGKAQVKRSGPWKEMDWILCDYYLPYALGGGYVLSYNLVKFIATNWEVLKLYNSEDVSVGLWLAPVANIERKHDVRFDTEYRSRGCSNQYIVTHKQSINSMRNMFELYQSSEKLCIKEIKSRMGYRYNWTVAPSQCCNRQSGII